MKSVWIWVLTMGLISAIFGVQLGLIPGAILSWIISSIVNKFEAKKEEEQNLNNKIKCPKCLSLNDINAEHCANCGALLNEDVIDVVAKPIAVVTENINNTEKILPEVKENTKNENDNDSTDKIMFCRWCGAKLEDGAKFCRICGKELK